MTIVKFQPALYFLALITVLMMGCQGSSDPDEAAVDQMMKSQKEKLPVYTGIRNYVNGINTELQNIESKGPLSVSRGGETYEVRVSYKDGEPVVIYTQTPMGGQQAWYYLENRQLVMLKEIGRRGPKYYESQFFYQQDTLLAAIHREAGESQDLPERPFKEYEPSEGEKDFRTTPADAFASAMEFLMGR